MGIIDKAISNMYKHVIMRRDTEDRWNEFNPVLRQFELVAVSTQDKIRYKYGDGTTSFKDLPYIKYLSSIDFYIMYPPKMKPVVVWLNPFKYDEYKK